MIVQATDNKTGKPLEHYTALFAAADPAEIERRTGFAYTDGAFELTLLSRPVRVRWPGMEAEFSDSGKALCPASRILLGRFLLEGALVPSSGKFKAYAELPWGSVYNAQFTGRCIRRLAASYGSDLERFAAACEGLSGKKTDGADAAYELAFLPGLIIRLSLWEGDDEFPASAQILFSDNFPAAFTAEDIAVAGDITLNALKDRW